MKRKILKIENDIIFFEGGVTLRSEHESDCCEQHYLDFKDIVPSDYEDLEFDLSKDNFFTRIPEFGIALNPVHGHPVRIPGYGYNNGYYSSNLKLVIMTGDVVDKTYDIEECQHNHYDNY